MTKIKAAMLTESVLLLNGSVEKNGHIVYPVIAKLIKIIATKWKLERMNNKIINYDVRAM